MKRAQSEESENGHRDAEGEPKHDRVSLAPGLGAEVGGVRCPRAQLPGGGPSQILPRGEPRQIVLGRRRATVSVDELAGRFRMLAEDEVTRRTLQPGNHFCRKR